ncbi:hypothetical protein [Nonomuraea basaltis]|uniref:hypothetical protein n=1 Tax=Nonomuraea basaltis TaxID=2495887 RepID=UPI00110C66D1|nr:hypothetical protein [Nonomuraea basaltis]TMR92550.1 hypothetical protein EJK15_43900 [Nonomuraea basaltis]
MTIDDESKHAGGRRTKLTPELQERLCQHIREGLYLTTACDLARVGESTVYRWLADATKPDAPQELLDFAEAIEHARAEAEHTAVEVIFKDFRGGVLIKRSERPDGSVEEQWTPPNGKLALEYLARTRRDRYQPVKALEITGKDGGPVAMSHGVDLTGLADRVAQAARDAQAGDDGGEAAP